MTLRYQVMMKSHNGILLIVCLTLIACNALAQGEQKWNKYTVSKSINTSNLNYKKLFHGKSKASLETNISNFYLYRNGALVKPTTKPIHDFFPAGVLCFKFDDTLLLNSGLGRAAGIGVGIKIFEGKFSSSLHAKAGDNSAYKFKKDDTLYKGAINVQPESQSLILLNRPAYSGDETIVGEYRAVFNRFYQKVHHKDESVKYTIRLIFNCKVTSMDSNKDNIDMGSK